MTVQTVFYLSQSRRLPLLQVVSNNKSFSVGVQFPIEICSVRAMPASYSYLNII